MLIKKVKQARLLCLLFFLNWVHFDSVAQIAVQGKVVSATNKLSLQGALIICKETNESTTTDSAGQFNLDVHYQLPLTLLVKLISFESDSIIVTSNNSPTVIILKENNSLKQVEIVAKTAATEISTLKPRNTEIITQKEILRAACCNLSESFETNPSVDVNYTDAITGAKEIQLLGLSGIYTQILTDNIPDTRGLAVPFGLNYMPGPLIKAIQISKGSGSVANGYEAISGQINVECKKPDDIDPFFLNLFADNDGRFEINTMNKFILGKKTSDLFFVNAAINDKTNDHNQDGFLDQPKWKQIELYNYLDFIPAKNVEGQFTMKAIYDNRVGGQSNYFVNEPISINNGYAVKIVAKRIQANLKTGMVFPESPWKSIGWQNSWTLHNQSSLVGLKSYEGNQQSYYSNLVYLDKIKTTDNQIKAGIDFKVDHFIESYNDSVFQTNEVVPGMYSEYTLKKEMKFGMVAGMRVDYHNLFGWLFTPRFNLKYNFTPELIVRFSGGRGYRTPHIYVDNTGLMASSKRLVVINTPKIEDGWNSGINFTYQFHLLHREASFTADLYRSWFNNQIVVDQYSQSDAVLFYNLNGSSTSNSFQAVMNYELLERLNLRIAYKTDDVKTDYIESPSTMKPLVPKNRALFSLSYLTKKEKWRFDSTLLWDGIKRLPNAANSQLQGHNHTEQNKEYSTDYFQWSAQITRSFKNWEIYIGAENILNYTQHEPILSSNDPFGPQFDATRVWGPLMDRKLYSGLRLTLK